MRRFFAAQYDVTAEGNFEGHNILNRLKDLPRSMEDHAAPQQDGPRLAMLRGKLLTEREKRIRPGLDDKVLADWNGLMIAALANAGALLGESGWIDMARRAFALHCCGNDPRRPARPFLARRAAAVPRARRRISPA